MTLTEYLNQGDNPKRMPIVHLKADEVIQRQIVYTGGKTGSLQEITINHPELPYTYLKVDGYSRLHVMDKDGNPRAYSCFYFDK